MNIKINMTTFKKDFMTDAVIHLSVSLMWLWIMRPHSAFFKPSLCFFFLKIPGKNCKKENLRMLTMYLYSLYRLDRKSTRLNSSHVKRSRMPSSA